MHLEHDIYTISFHKFWTRTSNRTDAFFDMWNNKFNHTKSKTRGFQYVVVVL